MLAATTEYSSVANSGYPRRAPQVQMHNDIIPPIYSLLLRAGKLLCLIFVRASLHFGQFLRNCPHEDAHLVPREDERVLKEVELVSELLRLVVEV